VMPRETQVCTWVGRQSVTAARLQLVLRGRCCSLPQVVERKQRGVHCGRQCSWGGGGCRYPCPLAYHRPRSLGVPLASKPWRTIGLEALAYHWPRSLGVPLASKPWRTIGLEAFIFVFPVEGQCG
jgi:hypothetical protein